MQIVCEPVLYWGVTVLGRTAVPDLHLLNKTNPTARSATVDFGNIRVFPYFNKNQTESMLGLCIGLVYWLWLSS